jgi:hypothetical protein
MGQAAGTTQTEKTKWRRTIGKRQKASDGDHDEAERRQRSAAGRKPAADSARRIRNKAESRRPAVTKTVKETGVST